MNYNSFSKIFFVSATIIFILLLLFFNYTKSEELYLGSNKLNQTYIKIYDKNNITILSEYLDIKYKTYNNRIYSLSDSLDNNLLTLDNLLLKSSKKEIINNKVIYYFDDKSKIKTKNSFQIVICNSIIYIVEEFNLKDNICN